MPLIQPFTALRPRPEYANAVVAPPYDVLDTEEARARAADNPWSFLHVSRPEIDFPAGTDPYLPAVYAKGNQNLERMVDAGVLRYDQVPGYYVYRLRMGTHEQTGLVVAASVAAYECKRIRKHELTQAHKVNDRARQISTLNAHTGPVAMLYRRSSAIDSLITRAIVGQPDMKVATDAGVHHTLWVVNERSLVDALTVTVEHLGALYIADGHHRTAAAAQVAAERRASHSVRPGERGYEYFLGVIFPDDEMQLLEYNRVVSELNGLTPAQFIEEIRRDFVVEQAPPGSKPAQTGEFGVYLPGQWYSMRIKAQSRRQETTASLDANLLAQAVLAPILGITDPADKRLDFVGGVRGFGELERRVDSGEMAAAFVLHPASVNDLMTVADAGQVMPPKSTWFEPKLADGLVSHVLD